MKWWILSMSHVRLQKPSLKLTARQLAPEKTSLPKRKLVCQPSIFQGDLLVLRSVPLAWWWYRHPKLAGLWHAFRGECWAQELNCVCVKEWKNRWNLRYRGAIIQNPFLVVSSHDLKNILRHKGCKWIHQQHWQNMWHSSYIQNGAARRFFFFRARKVSHTSRH